MTFFIYMVQNQPLKTQKDFVRLTSHSPCHDDILFAVLVFQDRIANKSMYDETILPVRNKVRIPSRSRTRIYFVQNQTKRSLLFLKWIELVICFLCLCFAIITTNATDMTTLIKVIVIISNCCGILLVAVELIYPYFESERPLSLIFQLLGAATNVATHCTVTILIQKRTHNHDLLEALLFLNGLASLIFLVDFVCKIIISTYLNQTTKVKSVVDVGVSAFLPPSTPGPGRSKAHRSILTATPITYGGTFPIGKNEPPFLPEERGQFHEDVTSPEKGRRHKSAQTCHFGDCKAISEFDSPMIERLLPNRSYLEQDEKRTSIAPFYLQEEHKKKSPWTCATPTSSRKIEPRRPTSMLTPITYSGTFAVNKDLVPITMQGISSTSPNTSPRSKKSINSRSEGNSPNRSGNVTVEQRRLDQISEEKLTLPTSSENCSLSRSSYALCEASFLPGYVIKDVDYEARNVC